MEFAHLLRRFLKALSIFWAWGDRRRAADSLSDLGLMCDKAGGRQEALSYLEQALSLYRETGQLRREARTLFTIGIIYSRQKVYLPALGALLLARNTCEVLHSPQLEEVQRSIDELHEMIGDLEFSILLAQVESRSQQIVDEAIRNGLR